jgi:hypothetical protein
MDSTLHLQIFFLWLRIDIMCVILSRLSNCVPDRPDLLNPNAFVSKLSDAEGEAAETQVWIEFSVKSGYLPSEQAEEIDRHYDNIQGKVVNMLNYPEQWRIPK